MADELKAHPPLTVQGIGYNSLSGIRDLIPGKFHAVFEAQFPSTRLPSSAIGEKMRKENATPRADPPSTDVTVRQMIVTLSG